MALRSQTRIWLDAASTEALAALGAEVGRLASEVAALRKQTGDQDTRRHEDSEALRSDLSALAERLDAHSGRNLATADDLSELQRRLEDQDAQTEDIRIALAGLTAQLRWESDDLRQGLAAIIERVERQRKQA